MKPIHLNLAARPYRDYRPLYAVVVVASLLIAWMMLNNIETYYRYVNETQTTRAEIAKLDAQTDHERQLGDAAKARIRNINVAALDRQTRFINSEIAERAFSWSELLDQLESILAPDTRILQITPTFRAGATSQVHLELSCEARTSQGMVGMINGFNRDPHFLNPFPRMETASPAGYTFTIGVEYKPSLGPSTMSVPTMSSAPPQGRLTGDGSLVMPAPEGETR